MKTSDYVIAFVGLAFFGTLAFFFIIGLRMALQ